MIVEGKKEFLKKLRLISKQGMLSNFLVTYALVFSGISLKRYWGFSLEVPRIALVMAKQALY